jgi:dsRNA-specific ribonuclease
MDNPNNKLITREEVENILNYFGNIGDNGERLYINNLEHYQLAFIHESYHQSMQNTLNEIKLQNNKQNDNIYLNYVSKESSERLEYLGDHILKAVMGRYLYERFGSEREGFLTRLKIKIEKCSMLHRIGVTLGFKKYLLLSLQVENQTILDLDRGRNTPSYYEDSFEAFIGSIVVDFGVQGYIYADNFVRNVIENIIDFAELISKNDNFKDSLQRFYQSLKWKTPIYTGLSEDGPLYRKVFTRMLVISNEQFMELDANIKNNIQSYTTSVFEEYKLNNPSVFSKLMELTSNGTYILGVGFGRKVTNAEQECAKQCLVNLELDLNY